MPWFIKKPQRFQAVQFDGTADSRIKLSEFAGHWIDATSDRVCVTTPSGPCFVEVGDWVATTGKPGDFYPIKADIFPTLCDPEP